MDAKNRLIKTDTSQQCADDTAGDSMKSSDIDAARLTLALNELRLPAIKALWPRFADQADKEGWRAARLLSALVEHELAERRALVRHWSEDNGARRRIERHIAQARLLPSKTLDTFDFTAVPVHRGNAPPGPFPIRLTVQGACQRHHRR